MTSTSRKKTYKPEREELTNLKKTINGNINCFFPKNKQSSKEQRRKQREVLSGTSAPKPLCPSLQNGGQEKASSSGALQTIGWSKQ
ncbi:hypothetical protein AVEN_58549-1 [Araneus ventricosus]|uniref:Uncharacterized protein n=1 Tax=Araneus ventricosus TaxID=182803 RepID=A0A4Y2PKT2_ARAVE|nr:hypothetical protein AVEN_58549-1 [Araneus ventricosus]